MNNIKRQILIIFFIFSATRLIPAIVDKSSIVINPGSMESTKYLIGWHSNIKARDLYNWGKSKGVVLIDDKGPVIDNIAGLISDFGSKIKISGLRSESFYKVRVDFVRFKQYNEVFNSKLKIFIFNQTIGKRLIKTVTSLDIMKGAPVVFDLPYEYSIHGDVELLFGDFSEENGLWGIWDVIVSENRDLPYKFKDGLKNYL